MRPGTADARKTCASLERAYFDAAIDVVVAAGQFEVHEVSCHGQSGAQYGATTP